MKTLHLRQRKAKQQLREHPPGNPHRPLGLARDPLPAGPSSVGRTEGKPLCFKGGGESADEAAPPSPLIPPNTTWLPGAAPLEELWSQTQTPLGPSCCNPLHRAQPLTRITGVLQPGAERLPLLRLSILIPVIFPPSPSPISCI